MEYSLAYRNDDISEDAQLRLVQLTRAQIVVLEDLIASARRMVASSRAMLTELKELRSGPEQNQYQVRPEGRLA
jgi:hypothetical protein